ncbi:RidA family protein [Aestuariivirga litoralis]|uniref:RidA family protein n=1 Tax=Aestuariivirga litoralis TaxID=2650924 RepID=UPI0018C79AFD|nr:RidA family protein [Aestuariivirga litoralis]MBG1231629.1 RidA family protein [Aestuariivirga litoralis]
MSLTSNPVENKLAELGIALPAAAKPVANYVPWVITGNLVFVAGQIPVKDGKPVAVGQAGAGVTLENAQAAARLCAINILAQVKDACGGDLSKVVRIVKLTGFVNCGPAFIDIPKVINGASDLMVEVFGDKGKHARAAVGASSLPLGVPVEVEAVVEIA